jgi:hypothetical protein
MNLVRVAASAIFLSTLISCSTTQSPQLIDYLQPANQVIPATVPTKLTDWGILRYGEDTIIRWGGQTQMGAALSTGTAIALATLSTAALAMAGSGNVNEDALTGIVAAGNWLLQMLGIIRPAERNDYRIRGTQDIISCRGEFFKGLAAKQIVVISTKVFTPQGAIYSDCIGGAAIMVEKQINGIRISNEDLKKVDPVPIANQPAPPPDVVHAINAEAK